MEVPERPRWRTKTGFMLASIGCAVGLANIWMFPWRVGQYGGAAFLIPYFVFLFAIGIIGITIEWGLGRSQDGGPQRALAGAGFPAGKWWGILPLIISVLVMAFYCNILGWSLKFLVGTITGAALAGEPGQFFGSIAFQPEAIIWFCIIVVINTLIVAVGVQKGIEMTCKVMMPLLFVLITIMAIWAVTLPGALEGLKFYLTPDISKLTPEVWLIALSQSIFTLSLGGGAMVVYGSYMRKNHDITTAAISVGFGNTVVAIMAGFAIFAVIFAFGLSPEAGPGLAFVSIPLLLQSMPGGVIWGVMFFLSLLFAGITGTVAMLEVNVDGLVDNLHWDRKWAAIGTSAIVIALGIPASISPGYFDTLVTVATVWMLPIAGLIAALAFLWSYGAKKAREHVNMGSSITLGKWWEPWAKYIYPLVIIVVLVIGIVLGISG